MVNPAPAVTTIESANAKEPDCPLACIGPAEWMATDSDPTKPNSGAVTDSDSDADTDTRPLAKLALSPTKALKLTCWLSLYSIRRELVTLETTSAFSTLDVETRLVRRTLYDNSVNSTLNETSSIKCL
jgi:hypothetical protein